MDRIEFRAGDISIFILPAMIVGLACVIVLIVIGLQYQISLLFYIALCLGALFFTPVIFIVRDYLTTRVFNRRLGLYYRGRKRADKKGANKGEGCALKAIAALQLIGESGLRLSRPNDLHSGASNVYSFELNIVLKDANRLNVLDHGDYQRIRKDATALAHFLDVPVWDATMATMTSGVEASARASFNDNS